GGAQRAPEEKPPRGGARGEAARGDQGRQALGRQADDDEPGKHPQERAVGEGEAAGGVALAPHEADAEDGEREPVHAQERAAVPPEARGVVRAPPKEADARDAPAERPHDPRPPEAEEQGVDEPQDGELGTRGRTEPREEAAGGAPHRRAVVAVIVEDLGPAGAIELLAKESNVPLERLPAVGREPARAAGRVVEDR